MSCFLLCLALGSCKRSAPSDKDPAAITPAPLADPLPALVLRDDTPSLLLTWVDDDGNFHVVQRIDEVPAERREKVRVVVTGQEAGTGQYVYVADLRQQAADGTYAVKGVARAEWDTIGAERRKSRIEALAPKAAPVGSVAEQKPGAAKLTAIIYGADWCKPCHQAEDFLRSVGVDVTKKNIETSEAAQAEMQEKLARAHRTDGSIPVIDFMGHIYVGFSQEALQRALDRAREPSSTL
jgi:glutaredoxin